MRLVQLFLDEVRKKIEDEFDRIIIVLGDEGFGKSTLMMQTAWFWQEDPTVESTLNTIAWDYDQFKEAMATRPPGSAIISHDAARVLHRKESMKSETITIEKDLLDVRQGQYFIMLGFQDFGTVPTMLAERRAHNVFRVTARGRVHVHNRENINKYIDKGKWPEPAFKDSFADLSGTELWQTFQGEDLRRKQERIQPEKEEGEMDLKEMAEVIRENGLKKVTSIHGNSGEPYIDRELIEIEYDLSRRNASKVAKLLRRDVEVPA